MQMASKVVKTQHVLPALEYSMGALEPFILNNAGQVWNFTTSLTPITSPEGGQVGRN